MMRTIVVLVVLTLAAPAAAQAPAPEALERAAAIVDSVRTQLHVAGCAFAIVADDRCVLARGFGVRDVATGAPVDTATLFPIGSCTKAFTAMAAVISEAQGRLALDDPPRRYLPWFRLADPEADAAVTIRDLLSHRTGLRAYADLAAEPGVLTRDEYVRVAAGAQPAYRLREKFQYSNACITAAGEIVAGVQHTSWEHAIERVLFTPLGMHRSVASLHELRRFPNHATGYGAADSLGRRNPVAPPASLDALAPAGAIAASAADMTRWLRFLLAEGMLDGRRIAPAAGVREAFTPHIAIPAPAADWSYGLGWVVHGWNGHRVVEHNGGSAGLSALVCTMPARRTGFVILMNASPNPLNSIGHAGELLWPVLLGEAAPPPPAASTAAAPVDSALRDTVGLPAVDTLLARMREAAGGARNLARHRTLELRGVRRYLEQGIAGPYLELRRAPGAMYREEDWFAAGHAIGRVRTRCDGRAAAQETTFGQDETFSGDALADARRDARFAWLLDPRADYEWLGVTGRLRRGDDTVLELKAISIDGTPVRWRVSERTALVVERVRGTTTERYSDFRNIDGCLLPFRTTISDPLGTGEIVLAGARFDEPVPERAFRVRRP